MIVLYDPANVTTACTSAPTPAPRRSCFGAALAAWLAIHGPATRPDAPHRARGRSDSRARVGARDRVDAPRRPVVDAVPRRLPALRTRRDRGHRRRGAPGAGRDRRACSRCGRSCALGLISYGVYLYHWPIDVVARPATASGSAAGRSSRSRPRSRSRVAIASYRLIEQPIRHGALSSISWRKLTPAIAIGLVLAICHHARTAPARSAPSRRRAHRWPRPPARSGPRRRARQRVMIVGDSVAYFLGHVDGDVCTQRHRSRCSTPASKAASFRRRHHGPCALLPHDREYPARSRAVRVGRPARLRGSSPNIVFWIMNGPDERGAVPRSLAGFVFRAVRVALQTEPAQGARDPRDAAAPASSCRPRCTPAIRTRDMDRRDRL